MKTARINHSKTTTAMTLESAGSRTSSGHRYLKRFLREVQSEQETKRRSLEHEITCHHSNRITVLKSAPRLTLCSLRGGIPTSLPGDSQSTLAAKPKLNVTFPVKLPTVLLKSTVSGPCFSGSSASVSFY